MSPQQKDALFTLLGQHCTNKMLRDLLREFRGDDPEIRLSGNSERILSVLRGAVDRGTIPIQRVVELLAGAEENGRQHIFYFQPKTPDVHQRCDDWEAIGARLFGDGWQERMGFPKFSLEPKGREWADLRYDAVEGSDYHSWTLKMYEGRERIRLVKEEELAEEDMFHKVYKREYAREIWLVKWHSHGLLEFRLPTNAGMSRNAYRGHLAMLWKAMEPAFERSNFDQLCLEKARGALIADAATKRNLYRIPNASFKDQHAGEARFDAAQGEDALDESEDRREAIKHFRHCEFLVVNWLNPQKTESGPDKLRTEIGTYFSNEVRIGSGTTPEAVQYVTNRLLELSR